MEEKTLEIIKIIDANKSNLIEEWYNFDNNTYWEIINWFINIANSIIPNEMVENHNIYFYNIFYKIPHLIEGAINDMTYIYKHLEENKSNKDNNPLWYVFFTKDSNSIINIYKYILNRIKKHNNPFWFTEIEVLKKYILDDTKILDLFNKDKLNKFEREIIIELKNKNIKKKEKEIEKIPDYIKTFEDYKEYSLYNTWIYEDENEDDYEEY